MEVSEKESKNPDCHMTSAVAFVDGGIQEACDDTCSVCLEEFCESDPSTVTSCKHEFHLQCILEWCQRSSQCPMCWQSISLKDPNSQELLDAVERERKFRAAPPRNRTIFHHPTLSDFELQHLPVGTNDSELEERIMQHLAAAAAMRRAHHIGRRDGQRSQSSAHGRQRFLVFSTHPSALPSESVSSSLTQLGEGSEPAVVSGASTFSPLISRGDEPSQQIPQLASVRAIPSSLTSGSNVRHANQRGTLNSLQDLHTSSYSRSPTPNQDRAGPSELQSLSESLKSRFSAASLRYKESFSRSTREWKERLFSRNNSMSEHGSEVRRELNAGIASVSRMMEGLETSENSITNDTSESTHLGDSSGREHINQNNGETPCPLDEGPAPASGATSSLSC